ncbi:MAG: efflux RND transporter periplasmic adaptor subunit, partial [Pseudomonadota bacterium]
MPRLNSSISTFAMATVIAAGIASFVLTDELKKPGSFLANFVGTSAHAEDAVETPTQRWAASATGRIEPKSGAIRVVSQLSGLIEEVAVKTNDAVLDGDLLIQLADDDYLDRIAVARAEEEVRRGERADEPAKGLAKERQDAEDAVFNAERELFEAWRSFDDVGRTARSGGASEQDVRQAHDKIRSIEAKLTSLRDELKTVNANADMPAPTRLESSLTIARAELALAENAFERTRIRAPFDGTVLNVFGRVGETVAAGGRAQPLVSFGDLDHLRVRAEVEERDVAKVRVGQKVIVRADAFPDQEFEGTVTEVASALGSPRITSRGPRRPNDVDVLEVVADLDGTPPLLTGMRVDVFFKPSGKGKQTAATM